MNASFCRLKYGWMVDTATRTAGPFVTLYGARMWARSASGTDSRKSRASRFEVRKRLDIRSRGQCWRDIRPRIAAGGA